MSTAPNNELQRTRPALRDDTSPLNSVFAGPEMQRALITAVAALLLTVVLPATVSAEVMDKEPTLGHVWVIGVTTAVLGFFAWRRHLAFGAAVSLLAAILAWTLHAEFRDAYVGPAIVEEAGRGYVTQAYGVMVLCAALHAAGAVTSVQARRRRGNAVA